MGPRFTARPYQSCIYAHLDTSVMFTDLYELNMSTVYWRMPIKFMFQKNEALPPHLHLAEEQTSNRQEDVWLYER